MLTKDERKQIQNFESAIADVIDSYLKEGMDPVYIFEVLRSHRTPGLYERRPDREVRSHRRKSG